MSRLFWAALGATAGVVAIRKVTRTAQQYTPAGMADGLAGLGEGLKDLAAAVREGMEVREEELRVALGIDTGTTEPGSADVRTMHPDTARSLIENPTAPRD